MVIVVWTHNQGVDANELMIGMAPIVFDHQPFRHLALLPRLATKSLRAAWCLVHWASSTWNVSFAAPAKSLLERCPGHVV